MNEDVQSTHVHNVELPSTAPLARVTAGLGSVAQKTWNLRRPVTLIGSRRPAHIVLHDGDISHAHCVIINTGTEVLLKDLHTRTGTSCNDTRIDLTLLKDGDVITVGAGRIQVAIQTPQDTTSDSGCGMKYSDPLAFPSPVRVGLIHTDQTWEIAEAAALIGRHEAARILLDHQDISPRHAILFRFNGGPAVFDLGGQNGVLVNGRQCTLAALTDGDRVTVGPFGLLIGSDDETALDVHHAASGTVHEPDTISREPHEQPDHAATRGRQVTRATDEVDLEAPESEDLLEIDSKLETARKGIASSWEQVNSWQARLLEDASEAGRRTNDLMTRESTLEAKDAELRGRLHDVTRYQEELEKRERELAAQFAKLQAERDKLAQDLGVFNKREAEVSRRAEELSRREHVFAQRWTRLMSAKCPHCGQPIGGESTSDPGDA